MNNPYINTLNNILKMVHEYPILEDYINNATNPTHQIVNGVEYFEIQRYIEKISPKLGDNSIYTLELSDTNNNITPLEL